MSTPVLKPRIYSVLGGGDWLWYGMVVERLLCREVELVDVISANWEHKSDDCDAYIALNCAKDCSYLKVSYVLYVIKKLSIICKMFFEPVVYMCFVS